jgi:hypothetical protein
MGRRGFDSSARLKAGRGGDAVPASIWLLKMMGEAAGQRPRPAGGGALAA